MKRKVDQRIESELQEAAQRGSCLVPQDAGTRLACRRRVSSEKLEEPARGIFVDGEEWQSLDRRTQELRLLHALSKRIGGATFCQASAALAHDLPVSYHTLRPFHVAVPPSDRRKSDDAIHYHCLRGYKAEPQSGLMVTPLWRTVLDCLLQLKRPDALAIADGFLRKTGTSKDVFVAYVSKEGRRRHGIRQAIETVLAADPLAESGGESIARAIMMELGFATPELQVEVPNPENLSEPYRVDFCWKRPNGSILLGELDGTEKYVNPEMAKGRDIVRVMSDERIRESRIANVTKADLFRFPFRIVRDRYAFGKLLSAHGVPRA